MAGSIKSKKYFLFKTDREANLSVFFVFPIENNYIDTLILEKHNGKDNALMNKLKLIVTEQFGNIACDFYRNANNDILLTREQIGAALEYRYPKDGISKIHNRHKDRLDPNSVITKLPGTDGKKYSTYLYTQRGIMEICRLSTKPKANLFMDWCWDIIEDYRDSNDTYNQSLILLNNNLSNLNSAIVSMQKEISLLEEKINKKNSQQKFSRWTNRMWPKYQLLMDYFDIDRKELYHNLFLELQNIYPEIDLAEMQDDFCYENSLDSCFTLEVIEHNKDLRTLFEGLVDGLLEKYHLDKCPRRSRHSCKTIFR